MTCKSVGTANPDIAGIGILAAFALQALISFFLSIYSHFVSWRLLRATGDAHRRAQECLKTQRRLLDGILLYISDLQALNGIALSLGALFQWRSLTLYHFHLIYDILNFSGISNCAAICCCFPRMTLHRVFGRYWAVSIFTIIYLIVSVFYGIRLRGWDENIPGRCYEANRIALSTASHPYVDNIYLGITCAYFLAFWYLVVATMPADDTTPDGDNKAHENEYYMLWIAMLQLPLHMYSAFALRASNQHLMTDRSETEWGFGQTVAMVMVGGTVVECLKGFKKYHEWKSGRRTE